ncbi:cytochrome c oxidase subunit II [Kiloniella sp.]|uniref:cytochrome c oxidase subunit II n=1 Tax=Kiloniella sp. TaxID=1938587 RepID=UPI003B01F9C0
MILVIVLVLLVVGSVVFSFVSPWWFTPLASNWGTIDTTLIITFVITGIVFVAVGLFMTYAVFRFRHKEGQRAHYEPENKKLEIWLSVLTGIGIIAMLAPGLVVWDQFITVPKEAKVIEVLGRQWSWAFRFPGEDGKLGTVATKYISDENPFGINPNDPTGQDDLLVDESELHLPVGKPYKLLLRSTDVLHDFYVPQFRAKMDLVPGLVTYFWFTPTRTGEFEILCAELCGVAHSEMRGSVFIDEEADFQEWLQDYSTFAEEMAAHEAKKSELTEITENTPQ